MLYQQCHPGACMMAVICVVAATAGSWWLVQKGPTVGLSSDFYWRHEICLEIWIMKRTIVTKPLKLLGFDWGCEMSFYSYSEHLHGWPQTLWSARPSVSSAICRKSGGGGCWLKYAGLNTTKFPWTNPLKSFTCRNKNNKNTWKIQSR